MGTLAADLGDLLWEAIKTIATPTAAKGMAVSRLMSVVGQLVAQVLTIADDTVDIFALLLIDEALNTS